MSLEASVNLSFGGKPAEITRFSVNCGTLEAV
jgi:hypothetical protein